MFTRKNVWQLGDKWAAPILWYARGVKAMKAKALADPTSWRFYAGIHGYNADAWKAWGYLKSTEHQPTAADKKRYWRQCQHGSWYFLPWHRGYLLAFEKNVRTEIVALHGPKTWALPYWNYFKPGQSKLPPAFASPDWPDGTGDNPLYVTQRDGPNDDGNVFVPVNAVNLNALNDPDFTGVPSGGGPGFGGVDTGFAHRGKTHGGIETQPHDMVHGLVGGQNPGGLMSYPDTAGLDPIFWLHHANIDRLWDVWRRNPPSHVDPVDPDWVKGPANIGERTFSMPMPGNKSWDFTPGDVRDVKKLGYKYDDVSSAAPKMFAPASRMKQLKVSAAVAKKAAKAQARNVELMGATSAPLKLSGGETGSTVPLDPPARRKVAMSLQKAVEGATPDRVFLNLENVRGQAGAPVFNVYVGLAANAKPGDHPEHLAGTIGLFGVREASQPDSEHAGRGITYVLEITHIIDALHLGHALDSNELDVRIVPVKPIPESAQISIGRISVYRQGR
jgi:tyrosinase